MSGIEILFIVILNVMVTIGTLSVYQHIIRMINIRRSEKAMKHFKEELDKLAKKVKEENDGSK